MRNAKCKIILNQSERIEISVYNCFIFQDEPYMKVGWLSFDFEKSH